MQRTVVFAGDMTAHGPIRPGLFVVSGAGARVRQRTIADLRSGGQTDSDCAATWLQITNIHQGSSYRFQLEGGFPCLVQRQTEIGKVAEQRLKIRAELVRPVERAVNLFPLPVSSIS